MRSKLFEPKRQYEIEIHMLFSIFDTYICYIQILGYLVEYPCKYLARLWKWQLSLLASQLVSTLTSSKKKCHCPVSTSSVENALYEVGKAILLNYRLDTAAAAAWPNPYFAFFMLFPKD